MSSTHEKGHAKQIDNFALLISFIAGYGSVYNPSKDALKLPQLQALLANANASIDNVTTQLALYSDTVTIRQEEFAVLKPLSTRIMSALKSSNASPKKIQNAQTYHRKIQGRRASPSKAADLTSGTPSDNSISVSQQSYTQQIQHFSSLLAVIKTEDSYMPNEVDLQLLSLDSKKAHLANRNQEIANAIVNISNARLNRNEILYNGPNSIYEIAMDAKDYIRSIFGTTSQQFAQIKGIKIKNR